MLNSSASAVDTPILILSSVAGISAGALLRLLLQHATGAGAHFSRVWIAELVGGLLLGVAIGLPFAVAPVGAVGGGFGSGLTAYAGASGWLAATRLPGTRRWMRCAVHVSANFAVETVGVALVVLMLRHAW